MLHGWRGEPVREKQNSTAMQFSEYSEKKIFLEVQESVLEVASVDEMNRMRCRDILKQHQHSNGRKDKTCQVSGLATSASVMFVFGRKTGFSVP